MSIKTVRGVYSALGYSILLNDGIQEVEIYKAGNSPHCSGTYVSAERGVGLETMRAYCQYSTEFFAMEEGATMGDVTEESDIF